MDYRRLNQTILRLMIPTATYMINVNVSTILRWSGKVYLLKICSVQKLAESVSVSLIKIKSVLLKNWQKQSQGCVLLKIDSKSHGSSAPKIGRKSHGSSAQKMAETHTQTDTHTHRQVSPLYSSEI